MMQFTEEQRKALIAHAKYLQTIRGGSLHTRHLIEIALVALTAEPVAWMVKDMDTGEKVIRPEMSYFEGSCQPLYTAPPATAPAAPDGWIKCSYRMPERHIFVTGYTDYDGVIYQMAVDDNGVWYTKDSDWSMTEVTHWMPAPAAPEAE